MVSLWTETKRNISRASDYVYLCVEKIWKNTIWLAFVGFCKLLVDKIFNPMKNWYLFNFFFQSLTLIEEVVYIYMYHFQNFSKLLLYHAMLSRFLKSGQSWSTCEPWSYYHWRWWFDSKTAHGQCLTDRLWMSDH